jgi:hypothetical protein
MFGYFLRTLTAFSKRSSWRATFFGILIVFLINRRTRLFARRGCDNGGARKKFNKFEFLQDKPTGNMAHLSDDAPNQHQECCISM